MPKRPKHTMPLELRAKQFAPFRALVGLEEALAVMEETPVPKPLLGEEALEDLNRELPVLIRLLDQQDTVPVLLCWYQAGQIHREEEQIFRIDCVRRLLYTLDRDPLPFDSLLSIREE